jgi:hypothetical protein
MKNNKFVCLSVSGSNVKGRISETMSIESRRCYAFVQDRIDRKVNQIDVFCHLTLSFFSGREVC